MKGVPHLPRPRSRPGSLGRKIPGGAGDSQGGRRTVEGEWAGGPAWWEGQSGGLRKV